MNNTEFLLHCDLPWAVYRTLLDLLDLDENDAVVKRAREEMLAHPLIQKLLLEMKEWPGGVLNSHKSAGMLYHKLSFLAEIGITKDDCDFTNVTQNLLEHRSDEGLFRLPINIPVHFGGTGQDSWGWAMCDAPLLLYSAAKMNLTDRDMIQKGVQFLKGLARENGWPCTVSKELGKFHGPGSKKDPCPYTNLIMLKLLALFDEKDSPEAHDGVECLLNAWETSRDRHPYMFFMGTDFRKLKVPFIWYDILHAVDVLSQFDFAVKDERFTAMLAIIREKAGKDGLFTPESIWQAWKDWDFGQKTMPSAWLTFLVYRINRRCSG